MIHKHTGRFMTNRHKYAKYLASLKATTAHQNTIKIISVSHKSAARSPGMIRTQISRLYFFRRYSCWFLRHVPPTTQSVTELLVRCFKKGILVEKSHVVLSCPYKRSSFLIFRVYDFAN